jgi:hypothetical protein
MDKIKVIVKKPFFDNVRIMSNMIYGYHMLQYVFKELPNGDAEIVDKEDLPKEVSDFFCESLWKHLSEGDFPQIIEGTNHSENVLAVCNGVLMVMCYAYVDGVGEDDGGYCWHNCYGKIDGDAEFDDNYIVDKWQYLPKI